MGEEEEEGRASCNAATTKNTASMLPPAKLRPFDNNNSELDS